MKGSENPASLPVWTLLRMTMCPSHLSCEMEKGWPPQNDGNPRLLPVNINFLTVNSDSTRPVISSVDSVQWLAIYWALAVCTGTSHPYLWATRMPACLSDSIVSSRALSSTVFLSNPPRSLLSHSWKVQLQQYGHWETKQMKRERETNRGLRVFFLAYQQDPLLIVSAG